MKIRLLSVLAIAFLASCSSTAPESRQGYGTPIVGPVTAATPTTSDGTSTASSLDVYKREIAERISQVNSTKVYTTRPQPLLRSVIVLRYFIDGSGNLVRSEIIRSNRDHQTEATALATLRATAPFPKPAAHLLRRGNVEISESWLFNNDGRFQLRSIALPQMNE